MSQPSLVVVSPLAPAPTGVADYTSRLLPYLARDWQITVVMADDDPAPESVPAGVDVVSLSEWRLARRLTTADRMLHCLGNSRFHTHVPDLCREHGGVVLAHDVRLTALHCIRAAADPDPHALSRLVGSRHGPEMEREVRSIEDRVPTSHSYQQVRARMEQGNLMLLGPAVDGADAVAVHSRTAERLASLELRGTGIPLSIVTFGCGPHPGPERDPVRGRVSSFGMVEPEKGPALIVDTLAAIRSRLPWVTLRLVGAIGEEQAAALAERTRLLGVSDAVSWTGGVDNDEYRYELSRAHVAVQLRRTVNGESSGTVADCLSAGVPTIVSRIGAARELPADVVRHVPHPGLPGELEQALEGLLCDDAEASARAARGWRYVEDHSDERAAADLTRLLRASPPVHAAG